MDKYLPTFRRIVILIFNAKQSKAILRNVCRYSPYDTDLNPQHLLTYSMVQSPNWAANWFAACQEIPRISQNPKVHYRTNKCPPAVPILGQPNPVHIATTHLLQIQPNIIHPSMLRSPQWSFSLRFSHQDPINPLSSPIRATCPTHLILLDFINHTILGEQYKSFSSSLYNLLHSASSTLCSFTAEINVINTFTLHAPYANLKKEEKEVFETSVFSVELYAARVK